MSDINICPQDHLFEGEEDWERWGCDYLICPGSIPIYQCRPNEHGVCDCYVNDPNSYPSIDDCGYCNYPDNQNINDNGCGCCVSPCLTCGSVDECPDIDCYISGGDLTQCCIENGVECGDNILEGCTDPIAENYDMEAISDDGTCEYSEDIIFGCTDVHASNFQTQAVCGIAYPDGCGGTCNGECPNTFLSSSCEYDGYIEPSIDRPWDFIKGDQIDNGDIYNQMNNFVLNECTPYLCDDPLPPTGDISNLYYGKIQIGDGEYSKNNGDILFAFINNELRGSSFIKNSKGNSYVYLEVKWVHGSELGLNIDFYVYVDGLYYSVDGIIKFGEDDIPSPSSEVTSDFGLF